MSPIDGKPGPAGQAGSRTMTLASRLFQQGKREEARSLCLTLIQTEPGNALAAYLLGVMAMDGGDADEAIGWLERCVAADATFLGGWSALAAARLNAGRWDEALAACRELDAFGQAARDLKADIAARCHNRIAELYQRGQRREAWRAAECERRILGEPEDGVARSAVIPVLDFSPGSPFNIRTLLADLKDFEGEVICVFNSRETFEALADHPRVDKYVFNKRNVGVSRAWNMGINQAEGGVVFILNADLHVTPALLLEMERHLLELPDAAAVGVEGDRLDPQTLLPVETFATGRFDAPEVVDKLSGYLFAIHAERFHDAGLTFDPRLAPYFFEEIDLGLKAREHGLRTYAVPVRGFTHEYGISARDREILFFGRPVRRNRVLARNGRLMVERWERLRARGEAAGE